jgi:hypothetical protein
VVLKDAAGNKLPGSGYSAAENGQLTINENIAVNAASGKVSVEVRCLASGKVGKAEFTIL